jgi:hypothetical protein
VVSLSSLKKRRSDPLERIIQEALEEAGLDYRDETENESNLDFEVPELGVFIETKRMHSPRIAEQMSRVENILVAQGLAAAETLARMIRGMRE